MFTIYPRVSDDYSLLQLPDQLASRPVVDPRHILMPRNAPLAASRESEVNNTEREFHIRLELPHYKPEEVQITSNKHRITVRAQHEEKKDKHGYVSRKMTRIYKLPADVDHRSVTSTMNSQGILSIKATKQPVEAQGETSIPVEFRNEA